MKKIFVLVSLGWLTISLTACEEAEGNHAVSENKNNIMIQQNKDEKSNKKLENKNKQDTKNKLTKNDNQNFDSNTKNEVVKNNNQNANSNVDTKNERASIIKNSNTSIKYPQFSSYDNNQVINSSIQAYIQELKDIYGEDLVADYQITLQNSNYVSLVYSGNIEKAAYPRQFKSGITIDLKNGNRVPLNAILNLNDTVKHTIEDKLMNIFKAKDIDFKAIFPNGIDNLLSNKEMTPATSDLQYYLINNEVVLIFSVPHAIGDYVECTLPY